MNSVLKKMVAALAVLLVAGVAASWAEVGSASADEIVKLLKEEPSKVLVLDVRTPREYAGGHIKGSVLIPMRQVPSNLSKIPSDKKVVVVCATGARSGAVADYLDKKGYPWVKNYSGGMMDWGRRGYPIDR